LSFWWKWFFRLLGWPGFLASWEEMASLVSLASEVLSAFFGPAGSFGADDFGLKMCLE